MIDLINQFFITKSGERIKVLSQNDLIIKCDNDKTYKLDVPIKSGFLRAENEDIQESLVKLFEEKEEEIEEEPAGPVFVDNSVMRPSEYIKRKLERFGGVAICDTLKGPGIKFFLREDGVDNESFPQLRCTWEIIDAIYDKAVELGGRMYRGDSAAQNGAKLGSEELPLDTIDGFISVNFYGNREGNSTLRRSTYYAVIMAWAGICTNNRAVNDHGGYISLNRVWH